MFVHLFVHLFEVCSRSINLKSQRISTLLVPHCSLRQFKSSAAVHFMAVQAVKVRMLRPFVVVVTMNELQPAVFCTASAIKKSPYPFPVKGKRSSLMRCLTLSVGFTRRAYSPLSRICSAIATLSGTYQTALRRHLCLQAIVLVPRMRQ